MGRNSVLIANFLLMCNWCRVITVSLYCFMVLLYRLNWSLSHISGLYCNAFFNMLCSVVYIYNREKKKKKV